MNFGSKGLMDDSEVRVSFGRVKVDFGSGVTRGISDLLMRGISDLLMCEISDLAVTGFSSEREETDVVSDLEVLGLK